MTSEAPTTGEEVLQATVRDVVFASDDGRYAVVRATRDKDDEPLTLVGDLGAVAPGEVLRVVGRETVHPTWGPRIQVRSFAPVMPTTCEGLVRYLGSGLIEGIGPALAERLVGRFKERTLDVIATESSRLREVSGIGAKRATSIAEALRQRRAEAETLAFLHAVGLGPALSRRVLKLYGLSAPRVLRENPYSVAEELPGVGFRTADRIGRACGFGIEHPGRAAGAALYALERAGEEGHAHMPLGELRAALVALEVPNDLVETAIARLESRGAIVREDDRIALAALHRAECTVAASLAARAKPTDADADAIRAALTKISLECLSDGQRAAVEASLCARALVLTGSPGTGKTTTVNAIVQAQTALGRTIALCAPTGRAAKRLSEATGAEAKTIHRLLEWNPQTGAFARNRGTPVEADLVLVDEASMLSLPLAESLFDALSDEASIVLVGDIDQLPPVGPGPVLREVIASDVVPVVRLREVFRQAQKSAIIRGAHAILRGQAPEATPAGTRGEGELYFVPCADAAALADKLVETVRRLARAYEFDATRDIQVLAPMRRGPAGTEQLNEVLQRALNPSADADARPGIARAGDRVMQLRNDYARGVFNGDLGEVRSAQGGTTTVDFDGRDVSYERDDLDDLTLAYCSTIHKVQGSEFPAVVVVLHASHYVLLTRPLLYTAVTRAQRVVVILGDAGAVRRAARNAETVRVHCHLGQRLRERALGATRPTRK